MKRLHNPARHVLYAVCLVTALAAPVDSTTVLRTNVADLVRESDHILVGTVISVTDGFDKHLPYTEISIQVDESLRGSTDGVHTFRQFGLTRPRDLGDGRTYLVVSPQGWPKFTEGEHVMLFLPLPSSLGFCTTIGLFQGKFTIEGRRLCNSIANDGLFENVSLESSDLLTSFEQKLLQNKKGPVDADTFISFIRKSVQRQWFEQEGAQ
jgi:hypothetical protein